MNKRVLLAAAVFAFAAFSLEAYETFKEAFQAGQKAQRERKSDEAVKCYEEAISLAKTPGEQYNVLNSASDVLVWQKRNLKAGIEKLDAIIQNDKMNDTQKVQALTKKGNFYRWHGKRKEAGPEFKKAMGLKPHIHTRHSLLYTYANYLISMNKPAEAESLLKEAAAIEKPTQYNTFCTKLEFCRLASAKKNYEEAMRLYKEFIALPKVPAWMLSSGYREISLGVYFPQKQYQEAILFLEDVEKNPALPAQNKKWVAEDKARAFLELGRLAASKKNYDDALKFFQDIIAMKNVPAWLRNAAYSDIVHRVYLPQKKYDDASKVVAEAEKDASVPANFKEWTRNVKASIRYFIPVREQLNAKNLEKAEEIMKSVPVDSLSKGSKQHFYNLRADIEIYRGMALKREKKIDEALKALQKAAAMDNTALYLQRRAYVEIATILMSQKKLDEAKAAIDTLFASKNLNNSQKIENQVHLAKYYLACQQTEDAIEALKKGLEIKGNVDPNRTAQCYAELALIYLYRKKDLDKAEEYYKAADAVPKATWGKYKWVEKQFKNARAKQPKN